MDETQKQAVDTPNPEWTAMMGLASELVDDLMGGTAAMKAAGTKWLPKEEKEERDVYNVRLTNSVLFGRFSAAVASLAGRPFSKPAQLLEAKKLPEQLREIEKSVDDEGRSLTAFARYCMEIGIQRGMVHLLVDYPSRSAANLAEERALGLRPLIVAIDPKDLFAWQYEKGPNGKKTLTQIRIKETAVEPQDQWGFGTKERVRVIYAGPPGETYDLDNPESPSPQAHWELYEKATDKDGNVQWVLIDQGPWTIGKISLVTVYFCKTGFMTAKCPLEDLAWLNLAHYQLASDHRNNLRFALARLIFGKGLSPDEQKKTIVMGVHHSFLCGSPNASMEIVGDDGSAAAAGENALRHLEDDMDVVAKGPLVVGASGNETATGRAIGEGKSQCELQSWVHLLEAGLDEALSLGCEWIGEKRPDDVHADIHNDFGTLNRATDDLDFLDRARARGDIDLETFLEGWKLRGVLPETASVKAIIARTKAEGPATGMIGREEEGEEDEDLETA